jgi:hypothetical protein
MNTICNTHVPHRRRVARLQILVGANVSHIGYNDWVKLPKDERW